MCKSMHTHLSRLRLRKRTLSLYVSRIWRCHSPLARKLRWVDTHKCWIASSHWCSTTALRMSVRWPRSEGLSLYSNSCAGWAAGTMRRNDHPQLFLFALVPSMSCPLLYTLPINSSLNDIEFNIRLIIFFVSL